MSFFGSKTVCAEREIGEYIAQRICRVNLQRTYVSETGLRSFQGHTTVLPKSSDLCLLRMSFLSHAQSHLFDSSFQVFDLRFDGV